MAVFTKPENWIKPSSVLDMVTKRTPQLWEDRAMGRNSFQEVLKKAVSGPPATADL
jgi:hypothetical protein